jgi:hypothetical protein
MVGLAEKTGQAWRFADYPVRRPFMDREGVRLMNDSASRQIAI